MSKNYICKHCKKEFFLPHNEFASHVRWCDENPNRPPRKDSLRKKTCKICNEEFNTTDYRRKICYKEECIKENRKPSLEIRKKLSESRKKYLRENRNKHNWSLYHREETKPERIFKEVLETLNIEDEIIQYYIPLENEKNYELDFALIDSKIAFEINGNQHYNIDGSLKEYYQERHNYFKENNWTLIEIPYLLCYKKENIKKIILDTLNLDVNFLEEKTKEIFTWKQKKNKIKEEKILLKRKEKKQKIDSLIYERRKLLNESDIDIMKFGWVKKVAYLWNMSHTQVRRWIKEYYSDLVFFERR